MEAIDSQGRTPLHVAVSSGKSEVVRLLLERGASASRADACGLTALHRAAWTGSSPLVDLLLSQGAPAGVSDREGDTPLHLAVRAGDENLVKRLLDGWSGRERAPQRRLDPPAPVHAPR